MYYVYMNFAQMRHCNIPPHNQLGLCGNNVTVDNTIPTRFGGMYVSMYVCIYVCIYETANSFCRYQY